MIFIFLSIAFQVWNALLLRMGESSGQERMVVLGCNYISATLLAGAWWALRGGGWPEGVTVLLGPVAGFFYATALFCFMVAMSRSGLAVSTTAMRMSVIAPVLVSLVAFGESPAAVQWAGIALTLLVIALLGWQGLRGGRSGPGGSGAVWLLALFVTMGGGYSTLKAFQELAPPADKGAMLTLLYFSAGALCWGVIAGRRLRLRRADAGRGLLLGVSNVTANALTLLGLERVPGVVAFPLLNIGVILLASCAGIAFWRERPGTLEWAAIALAAAAVVLITR